MGSGKDTKKELEYQLYVQREKEFFHEPYENEQSIFRMIKNGDVDGIIKNREMYSDVPFEVGKGNLSDNPLRNHIYHFIVNTALVTRICSSAGLPHETAYTLSDIFIRRADTCKSVSEVIRLGDEMSLEFARQMKNLKKNRILSPKIRQVINYICDNLHRKITVNQLAELTGLNKSYLCELFKKEMSLTIQKYILIRRIETAQKMLLSTDYRESDIAYTLGFSSQSYFCKCFKAQTGFTPREYKFLNSEEYE